MMYALFVDYRAAFEEVDTGKIFECTRERGEQANGWYGRLRRYTREQDNKMKVGEKEGDWFETTKRVRQGSPHSPPLFTIYVVEMLLLLLLLISCSTGKSQLKSMYVKESTSLEECGV
jgi:hypothetical protein